MLRYGLKRILLLACFSSLTACSTIAEFETISGEVLETEEVGPVGPPLKWQKALPPAVAGPVGIVMSEGNVHIAGSYSGAFDLGGGALPSLMNEHYHTFLGRFDAETGNHEASVGSTSSDASQVAHSLSLGPGGVVVGGIFSNAFNLAGCELDVTGLPAANYIALINANLKCAARWSFRLDGGSNASTTHVASNNDGVYAGLTGTGTTRGGVSRFSASNWNVAWLPPKDDLGEFTAPPTLAVTSTTARSEILVTTGDFLGNMVVGGKVLSASTAPDAFLAAYNEANGSFLWSQTLTGKGEQNIFDSVQTFVNGADELYVTGGFDNEIVIGAETFISAGGRDAFIARIDPTTGTVKQAFTFGDGADQNGHVLAFDPVTQRVVLLGGYRGKIEFQNGFVENTELEDHLYMMIFSTDLKLLSLTTYGKGGKQTIRSAFAADSNLFLTGLFFGELDFGDPNTKMVNDTSLQSMFWARIGL